MCTDSLWTTIEADGVSVEVRTGTPLEVERADGLMEESEILTDVLDELSGDDVFLDIGANVGIYSLFAARTGASVVSFEPHPLNLQSLRLNIDRNDADVTVFPAALADTPGSTELFVAEAEAGSGTHTLAPDQVGDESITVDVATGDALLADGEIPDPTVAKLDVQGAELLVLRGLETTLAEGALDVIYLEIHPNQIEKLGGSVDDLQALLADHGFELNPLVEKEDVTWNVKAVR